MNSGMFKTTFFQLLLGAFLLGMAVWGIWELVDWIFIEDVITSTERIEPTLKLTIEDGKVDTLYIYKK